MLSASSFTPSDTMSLLIVCQQLSQLSRDTTHFAIGHFFLSGFQAVVEHIHHLDQLTICLRTPWRIGVRRLQPLRYGVISESDRSLVVGNKEGFHTLESKSPRCWYTRKVRVCLWRCIHTARREGRSTRTSQPRASWRSLSTLLGNSLQSLSRRARAFALIYLGDLTDVVRPAAWWR